MPKDSGFFFAVVLPLFGCKAISAAADACPYNLDVHTVFSRERPLFMRWSMTKLLTVVLCGFLVSPLAWAQATGGAAVISGTGPGVHGANSPFKPLAERADVVSWKVLSDVKVTLVKGRSVPTYGVAQLTLNQKLQRVQGFMLPLQPGEKQSHFLLSSVPPTCNFCMMGGPESIVEVKAKVPVPYTLEAVVVEGQFLVLNNDPFGLFYRVIDAVAVK